MLTTDDNNSKGPGSAPSAPQGGGQQRQAASPEMASILEINSVQRRAFTRSSAGEEIVRLTELFRQALVKSTGEDLAGFRLIQMDATANNVALGAIILAKSVVVDGKPLIAMHRLILDSGARLPSRYAQLGGNQIEIMNTPGDVDDQTFYDRAKNLVFNAFGGRGEVVDARMQVVPHEIDLNDERAIRDTLFNATAAVETTIDQFVGGPGTAFNVGLVRPGDQLIAQVDNHPVPVRTAAGLPIRSDISVALKVVNQSNNQNVLSAPQGELAHMDGFVDLVFAAQAPQQFNAPPVTAQYYPRLVLTNVTPLTDVVDMEHLLLALVQSTILTEHMAWAGVFKPRFDQNKSYRDIGALGLAMPSLTGVQGKGIRVDTNPTMFNNEKLIELVQHAIHNSLIISMDVEEAGDMSWLTTAFYAAACGNPDAHQFIYDAANNLTKGQFGRLYDPTAPIVLNDDNRIFLGYYQDETGERKDIRDYDFLAMLNRVGDTDLNTVFEWSETFNPASAPAEARMEKRWHMLQGAFPGVKLTGYARRVTFAPAFLMAIAQAAASAGLNVRPGNVQSLYGGVQRGIQGLQGVAFSQQVGNSALFSFSASPQVQNGMNRFDQRWNRTQR